MAHAKLCMAKVSTEMNSASIRERFGVQTDNNSLSIAWTKVW